MRVWTEEEKGLNERGFRPEKTESIFLQDISQAYRTRKSQQVTTCIVWMKKGKRNSCSELMATHIQFVVEFLRDTSRAEVGQGREDQVVFL